MAIGDINARHRLMLLVLLEIVAVSTILRHCSAFASTSIAHKIRRCLLRWQILGNLDVTLIIVFWGGLRQNFHKTFTTLRQNFDKTLLMRIPNYPKHSLGAAKRPPRGILLSLGSHQQSFVEVLSKFCQSVVEVLSKTSHKDKH